MVDVLHTVGFTEITIAPIRYDVFGDAPSASSAAEFGTEGIVIAARKPV